MLSFFKGFLAASLNSLFWCLGPGGPLLLGHVHINKISQDLVKLSSHNPTWYAWCNAFWTSMLENSCIEKSANTARYQWWWNSPNLASINALVVNFADAQRAMSFINALQPGETSSSGFNTNVDMFANPLIRNLDYDPAEASRPSSPMETGSQAARRRYLQSSQSEVGDPDLWLLHCGEGGESENAEEDGET